LLDHVNCTSSMGTRHVRRLQMFLEIDTMDSLIKFNFKNSVNRSRELGTSLTNEVSATIVIDGKIV
jgi:hypothetical protein